MLEFADKFTQIFRKDTRMNPQRFLTRLKAFSSLTICLLLSSAALGHNQVVVVPLDSEKTPVNSSDEIDSIENVLVVAKSGGDFSTLAAAMDSISTASESNPFLIFISPGEHVLSSRIEMKEHVYIQGSGREVTKIISTIPGNVGSTFLGNRNSSISSLSVFQRTTVSYPTPVILSCSGLCPIIENVEFEITDSSFVVPTTAINFDTGSVDITDSKIISTGREDLSCAVTGLMAFGTIKDSELRSTGSAICAEIDFSITIDRSSLEAARHAIEINTGIELQESIQVRWSELRGGLVAVKNSDRDPYEELILFSSQIGGGKLTEGANIVCVNSVSSSGDALNADCSTSE